MTDLLMFGMPEDKAEEHRRALRDLRMELEPYDMSCRLVERIRLPLHGYYRPMLLPPEMDVYAARCLIATVTVVDVPGGGGAWFVVKDSDGLPVRAKSVGDLASAARDLAARHEEAAPARPDAASRGESDIARPEREPRPASPEQCDRSSAENRGL